MSMPQNPGLDACGGLSRSAYLWARSHVLGSPVSPLDSRRASVGFLLHLVFKELQDVCGLGQRPDGTGCSGLGFKGGGTWKTMSVFKLQEPGK